MRSEAVERRLSSLPDLARANKRINGLFRLLASPVTWHLAYESIAKNRGALTPGVDPTDTLDGMSEERIRRLINEVMSETYRFKPARRRYIPKSNGKLRPLGIPTANDKLVQAAVKIVLEPIFEAIFKPTSHGFRPKRSCHTALDEIQNVWTGVKWLIEVDVKSFFDNIDHQILLDQIRKRVDDDKLLRLIGRMLKAGIMENWSFTPSLSGTPQGGVISPLFANIYLHALDEQMEEMKLRFNKGDQRRTYKPYRIANTLACRRRREYRRIKTEGRLEEAAKVLVEVENAEKAMRSMPCADPMDPNYKRLLYCRYADDFLIGVVGSKDDAKMIQREVVSFLKEELRLETAADKQGIHWAKNGSLFLGYTVCTYRSLITKRRKNGTFGRSPDGYVTLRVPETKLAKFVEANRLGNYWTNRGEHNAAVLNNEDVDIVVSYNAVMRGLAEYYKLGKRWRTEINRVHHVWWWSLMKSLAFKHKCSVAKIGARLREKDGYAVTVETPKGIKSFRVFRLKDIKNGAIKRPDFDKAPFFTWLKCRNGLLPRLQAEGCWACGDKESSLEIHHVKRMVKDMKGVGPITFLKAARTRKRIPLCGKCHDALHAGKLQARLDRLKTEIGAG